MSSSAFCFHRTATLPEVLHVVLRPFMEMVAYTLKYAMNTSCIALPNTPYITISYHTTYSLCLQILLHAEKKQILQKEEKMFSLFHCFSFSPQIMTLASTFILLSFTTVLWKQQQQ